MKRLISAIVATILGSSAVYAQEWTPPTPGVEVTRAAQQQSVVKEWTPLIVSGDQAVDIVTGGEIRTSSNSGFEGFLLLIEYNGRNYTCSVTAQGQVLPCYELVW